MGSQTKMSRKKKEPEDKIKKYEKSERGGQIKKAPGGSEPGNQRKKASQYSEPVDQIKKDPEYSELVDQMKKTFDKGEPGDQIKKGNEESERIDQMKMSPEYNKEGNQIKKGVEDTQPEIQIMKIPEDKEPGHQIKKTPECSKISGQIKIFIEDVTGLCTFEDFHTNQPLVHAYDLLEDREIFEATPLIASLILKPSGQRKATEAIKINEDLENDKEELRETLSPHRKWGNEINKALEDVTWLCFLEGVSNDQSMVNVDRPMKIFDNSKAKLESIDITSNISGLTKDENAKKVHTNYLPIQVESLMKKIKKSIGNFIEEKFIKSSNEIQDEGDTADKLANDAKYRELETANVNTEQKSEEPLKDIHTSTEKHTKQQPKEERGGKESDGTILQLEEPLKGIHTSTEKRTIRQPNEERGEKESDDNEILHLDEEPTITKFSDYKQKTDSIHRMHSTKSSENSSGLRNTLCLRIIEAFSRKLKDVLGFCLCHLDL